MENSCGIMYPRGGDENWGIGAYWIPNNSEITLYKDDNCSEKFGTLLKKDYYIKLYNTSVEYVQYNRQDCELIVHFNYEFLKIYESQNESLKVFCKSFQDGLYAKKSEVEEKTIFYTYSELIFSDSLPLKLREIKNGSNLGVNLNNNCLNLREQPNVKSKKVRCIPGNDIHPTGYTSLNVLNQKGDWAFVQVMNYEWQEYDEEIDCGELINRDSGWVKVIDESGFPNLWYSQSGY